MTEVPQVNQRQSRPASVAVVGGGISGLAAAHHLVERGAGVSLCLLEATSRLGGVLSTVHEEGFQVEQSADNFITTVPWGLDLCRRVGLGDQIVATNPAHRRTFVVRRGRLHRLPDGFLMMAPTRLWPLLLTPILSPWGKLRAAWEWFVPPRRDGGDESMAAFVRRRLGREVFDRLVEPLVSAVYAADLEKLSVEATLVRFRQMEQQHGSLIRALRRQLKQRPQASSESGPRYGMFVTLREGLGSLVAAIAARLPANSVYLNTAVTRIEAQGRRWRVWTVACPNSQTDLQLSPGQQGPATEGSFVARDFDAVILATPAHVAARLLAPINAQLAKRLGSIEHSGTAIVSLGYDRRQIGHPLDGMGAVVPAIEQSPILACSFSSQKYAHRAPLGKVLLRVFVGGSRRPELAEMEDEPLLQLVLQQLEPLLSIRGQPVYRNIARWPATMPQYHVGHTQLVAEISAAVERLGNLQLCGNALRGVGIPDCIRGGELAAERILSWLAAQKD